MDEDPLLMSLADALTCAFGASIALFLVFVVLVRFDPPAPQPASGMQSARTLTASLAEDKPGASSLVILAQSTLDAVSCEESAVHSLKLTGTDEAAAIVWDSQETLWSGPVRDGVLCRRIFEIPAGVTPASIPGLKVMRGNTETITLRVHVGANAWPSWNTFHHEPLSPGLPPGGVDILRVTGDREEPVLTGEDLQ